MAQERSCNQGHVHFGNTEYADSIPDCALPTFLMPSCGPVYAEGKLVLPLSFKSDFPAQPDKSLTQEKPLERYRLWDDEREEWFDSYLEVARYGQADVVEEHWGDSNPVWIGALDLRKRIVLRPNDTFDLCWKRV